MSDPHMALKVHVLPGWVIILESVFIWCFVLF